MSNDKQQEAFEAWWRDYFAGVPMTEEEEEVAAIAWQAAQQELQAPIRMRDPVNQAMGLVNEWNEGVSDYDEWGNEACQAMFALSDHIRKFLIESDQQAKWLPIESAPEDGRVVDIWSQQHGRLTSYKRTDLGNGNVFYEPTEGGYSVVRDATHWRPIPLPPEPKL